ncbi:DUF4209 domain-containing protein [uncultured Martelella sp.]|uniref:DUF4209 domain-containing protein n=1 Tax=uncultured Martelella sp. TaxID=392331 RepID=UPI0029C68116|nr:DUF4209 domain-containing protein [uncultured Martelella sp.]
MAADESQSGPPFLIASFDDLAAVDLDVLLGSLSRSDVHSLEKALGAAIKEFEATGDERAQRACRLLFILCSFHLRIDDPASAWGPRWQEPSARSYIASDLRGEQNDVMATIAADIAHPALRARMADVVWYNDRSKRECADVAIEAYCTLIRKRLDGEFTPRSERLPESIIELVDYLKRSFQIITGSRKRGEIPDLAAAALEDLYQRAFKTDQYVAFRHVAELGIGHKLLEVERVASDAEALAARCDKETYRPAVKSVLQLAAYLYKRLGDDDAKRRCHEHAVDQTLAMRDQLPSPMVRAYWTRVAIGELREAGGFKERIQQLRFELLALQDEALDETGQFSIPMDLSEERKTTTEYFAPLVPSEFLRQFALMIKLPKVSELREQALKNREEFVASTLFGASYTDREGKTVAETPAAPIDGEPDEDWMRQQSIQYLDMLRAQWVNGFIEPARRVAMERFPVEERHLAPIVGQSPFVPPAHGYIFALGLSRFFQGDFVSAANILVPQLENSVRHVLQNANRDTSKMFPDLLQEDRSLSGMLESSRDQLIEVFGADLTHEIDMLFIYKPGPSLRHEIAHGKLTEGEYYHYTAIFACWLVYHLTCLPLIKYGWNEVAPSIDEIFGI